MQPSQDPMCSLEDTRVSHSVLLGKDLAKAIRDICGQSVLEPYASYDPDTHCLRMYEVTLVSDSHRCLATLPPSGSMQNGKLYQRARLAHHTDAIGCLLWPTPTTQEVEHPNAEWTAKHRRISSTGATHSMGLADAMQMWPTPQVDDSKNVNPGPKRRMTLAKAVQLWPTPRAAMGQARNHTVYERSLDKPQNLENQVAQRDSSTIGGKLNPMWVEWLMGFPLGWTDLEHLETQ